jgi:uncharacterized caspase-like protein
MHQTSLRRLLLSSAASLALLSGCGSTPRGAAPARVALVIGNAAYENAPALVNPANDARDMCAALGRLDFKTLCHVNVRDRAEFDARVREYAEQLGPGTVGVFFYSGHGVQSANANFLIPTQAQTKTAKEDPLRGLYGVEDLFDRLRGKPTRFQLVILDACRTELLVPGTAGGRSTGSSATPGLIRSLQTVARASDGLGPIKDAPPDTLVLYATASKDGAYDGDGRNGPLTKHVLAHIGARGLYVEDFLKLVTTGVQTETARAYGRRQTPFVYGSFGGRFCFAGCPNIIGPPPIN